MAEIAVAEGLEPERLGWVADLYGRADPKYRRRELLDHLFSRGPLGAALHAFALDAGRPVGHCAVVPLPARRGSVWFRSGKLEALFVAESHRGRRSNGEVVARSLLTRLYEFADERGVELIYAYVTPRVGRVTGFAPVSVGARSLVAFLGPGSRRRAVTGALAHVQRVARETGYAAARARGHPGGAVLRPLTKDDVDLAAAPLPTPDRWTSVAQDAWDWYRRSPVLRVLELEGRDGSRALVQMPGAAGEAVRLVGWQSASRGLGSALLLVGALGRLARHSGAAVVRFQPWPAEAGDGALARACRLVGFVPRNDFTTLWIRAADAALTRTSAVVPSPVFYLGF
jgi:GNAT superfamily N-acetyltransferase